MSLKRLLLVFCVVSCLVLVSCMESSYVEPPAGIPRLATPTIWIEKHDITVNGKNIVRISSSTDGAEIYYTTNGVTPSKHSTMYYADAGIPVDDTVTIKAIVLKDGNKSSVETKWFHKVDDKPKLVVDWNTLKIESSATYIYYAEDSTEKNPKEMVPCTSVTIITPSVKSVSGINYTVVAGENGYINSVLEKNVMQSKLPSISDPEEIYDPAKRQIRLTAEGSSARYTVDGTNPTPSIGEYFSGLAGYLYYYNTPQTIKIISFETGKFCSEIVSRNF